MELALLMPLLLMMVLGLVDFGRAILGHMAIEEAAQEGVLFAAYHGGDLADDWGDIVDAVELSTDSLTINPANVSVVCSAKAGTAQLASYPTVVVTVDATLTPITPFVSAWMPGGIPLSASASGTVFTNTCLGTP